MPVCNGDLRHSIRCLKAIEGYHGGRIHLAQKMGVSAQTIAHWVHNQSIPASHVLSLMKMGDNKFTAEELLGEYDEVSNANA